jgi:CheY-like chemotaxis protein
MDDYLSKPVKQAQLKEMIDRWLEITGSRRGREEQNKSATPAPTFSGHKILLVEDNQVNQTVIRSLLKKLGYAAVELAKDGQEAVDKALAEPFDIILMDCQMPRLDGYEATRALRGAGIALPIVAVTASAMEQEIERCFAVGMNDVLAKPVTLAALGRCIEKHLSGAGHDDTPVIGA